MSAFGGLILTNKGRALQAKAQTGVQLNFNRIAVGDGVLGSSSIPDLNTLKSQIKSLAITKVSTLPGGKAVTGAILSNQGLASGFFWREIGLFAQDPDEGEILYCYGNAGNNAEYIPAGSGPDIAEKNLDIVSIVGNASNVTATIEQSLIFVSTDEFNAYKAAVEAEMDSSADTIAAMKAPIGFVNRADSTFSFNKSSRVFTIQPTGASYDIYCKDKKYTKTGPESVTIPNATGLYFIYFNPDGVLSYSTTFPGLQNMIYVSYLYWNTAQSTASLQFGPGDERHGTIMDKATHERMHAVDWTQWVSGLQVYGYTLADGTNNDSVKISITNGVVADEDLFHNIHHSASPVALFEQHLQSFAMLPVLYRDGENGEWKQDAATAYPFKNTSSGRVNYNQNYGGGWKQTQLGSGQFIAYYVVFTADVEQPIKVVQGQRTDNSLANAQANNDDRNLQWGSIPFQEFKVLYRLIFETNDAFANDRKAALRDVLDLRAAKRSPGGGGIVPSAHSNLTGLDYATSGHVGFASDAALTAHLADYEYQTPVIVGTQIRITRQSNTDRLFFKLAVDLSGGAITISLDGGATSLPLKDIDDVAVTELSKGFVEVVENTTFFIYAPKGGTKITGQSEMSVEFAESISKNDSISLTYKKAASLVNPTTMPSSCFGMAWSPDGVYFAVAGGNKITIYKNNGNPLAKLSDPSTLPTGTGYDVAWSPDGIYLAVIHATSPFLTVYKRNGDIFSKLSNPSTLPQASGNAVTFSPDGQHIMLGLSTSPFLIAYKLSSDILTKLSNWSNLPADIVRAIAYADNNTVVVNADDGNVQTYKRTGDVYAYQSVINISNSAEDIRFSSDGLTMYIPNPVGAGNGLLLYTRTTIVSYVWTRKYLDYVGFPTSGANNALDLSTDKTLMVMSSMSAPYIIFFSVDGNNVKNLEGITTAIVNYPRTIAISPDKQYIAFGHTVSPYFYLYKLQIQANKSLGKIIDGVLKLGLGYAKENGSAGDTKKVIKIWG